MHTATYRPMKKGISFLSILFFSHACRLKTLPKNTVRVTSFEANRKRKGEERGDGNPNDIGLFIIFLHCIANKDYQITDILEVQPLNLAS